MVVEEVLHDVELVDCEGLDNPELRPSRRDAAIGIGPPAIGETRKAPA